MRNIYTNRIPSAMKGGGWGNESSLLLASRKRIESTVTIFYKYHYRYFWQLCNHIPWGMQYIIAYFKDFWGKGAPKWPLECGCIKRMTLCEKVFTLCAWKLIFVCSAYLIKIANGRGLILQLYTIIDILHTVNMTSTPSQLIPPQPGNPTPSHPIRPYPTTPHRT